MMLHYIEFVPDKFYYCFRSTHSAQITRAGIMITVIKGCGVAK